MTTLTRYEPFNEMAPVRDLMERFFSDMWPSTSRAQSLARPLALDMFEAENEVVVKAALPGFTEKDVDVTVEQGNLTIRAHRSEDEDGNGNVRWVHRELWPGEYVRSVILPSGLQPEKAEAEFTNGILILHIPKAESARPKQIKISAK